jgi:hypothetical protein
LGAKTHSYMSNILHQHVHYDSAKAEYSGNNMICKTNK